MNTKDIKCYIDDEEVDCSTCLPCDQDEPLSKFSLFQEHLDIRKFLRSFL